MLAISISSTSLKAVDNTGIVNIGVNVGVNISPPLSLPFVFITLLGSKYYIYSIFSLPKLYYNY